METKNLNTKYCVGLGEILFDVLPSGSQLGGAPANFAYHAGQHGFGWTLGVGDGQGGLACCGSRGRKESDTTEQLNWQMLNIHFTTTKIH